MKTLLSIDWDFFVPEKVEWDFGHQETLFHLNFLWTTRLAYFDQMKTTGAENSFWDKTGLGTKPCTFVSDSHCFAYNLLRGIDHVVLVDAHHDCWKADSLGTDDGDGIYCHNWLRAWLKGNKKRRATWVCPEWASGSFILPKDIDRVEEVCEMPSLKDMNVKTVHVCRSGCWTPPWLDKKFIDFVNGRGAQVFSIQNDEWNPMIERWTEEEIKSHLEQENILKVKMSDLRKTSGF